MGSLHHTDLFPGQTNEYYIHTHIGIKGTQVTKCHFNVAVIRHWLLGSKYLAAALNRWLAGIITLISVAAAASCWNILSRFIRDLTALL